MTRILRRAWLRYHYGFEMAMAYLASHMDDPMTVANHETAAGEVERLYAREMIN